MRVELVVSPTGTLWEVRSYWIQLPRWRTFQLFADGDVDVLSLLLNIVLFPIAYVLVPLLCLVVELPLAVVRTLTSDVAWVEARCDRPVEERRLWQTTRADRAVVCAAVVESLSAGGTDTIPRAVLVEAT